MKQFLTKDISVKALDIDTTGRKVKFAFAQMGSIDRDGDIFDYSAFNKSINERGPKGTNEIFHLLDHMPRTTSMLSKMSEVYTEGEYLVGVSAYRDSFAWREVAWPAYEAGDITQHSIGFSIMDDRKEEGGRIITQALIWEGSAVLWGANPNTPTLEVSKTLGITQEGEELPIRIEKLTKAIKADKFDEELKGLLIIELTQIHSELTQKTIEPTEKVIQPEVKGVDVQALEIALIQFKNKVKTL